MASTIRSYDRECIECGQQMLGINTYRLRRLCDACGGNKTEYDHDHPNPNKISERKVITL